MRGKAQDAKTDGKASRITPACAGKSSVRQRVLLSLWDHPRMCGEKTGFGKSAFTKSGSPPHVRGKAGKHRGHVPASRITPAYAGKSPGDENRQDAARDHPRVCGEKKIANSDELAVEGSPPRMRGKVLKNRVKSGQPRITPAYAGKRLKRSRSTVPPVAIVPLFPSVCNKPVVSDGSPAGRDAPLFLPAENAVPASPAYNLRSL